MDTRRPLMPQLLVELPSWTTEGIQMVANLSVLPRFALALGLLLSAHGTSAMAEFSIRNVASGLVVDVIGASTADFQGVILFHSNGNKNQLFNQNVETDNTFSLAALHSFKCLDVLGFGTGDG